MKSINIFFLIVMISSCGEPKNQYSEKLVGEWTADWQYFSFHGSNCLYRGGLFEYNLIGDTIVILDGDKKNLSNGFNHKYLIVNLSDSSLILEDVTRIGKNVVVLGRSKETEEQTIIELQKVGKKNDFEPVLINFSSSSCFGSCPSMYLIIDDSGNMIFWGRAFTELKGVYKGHTGNFPLLRNLVHELDLKNWKNEYKNNRDTPSFGLRIITENDTIQTVGGKGPIELQILYKYLIKTYKTAELMPDSSVIDDIELMGRIKNELN